MSDRSFQTFSKSVRGTRRSKFVLADVLLFLVENGPGRTEMELAEAVFGHRAYQQRVNQDCVRLITAGAIERRGIGGPGDPYRYYPIAVGA